MLFTAGSSRSRQSMKSALRSGALPGPDLMMWLGSLGADWQEEFGKVGGVGWRNPGGLLEQPN